MDNEIESIQVWTSECYACHSERYESIMRFVLDNKINLKKYRVIRIPLKKEWVMRAKEIKETKGLSAPFVIIETKGETIMENAKTFKDRAEEIKHNILQKPVEEEPKKRPAKKIAKKTASIKKEDVAEK